MRPASSFSDTNRAKLRREPGNVKFLNIFVPLMKNTDY